MGPNITPRYWEVFIEDKVEDVSFGMGREGEVLVDSKLSIRVENLNDSSQVGDSIVMLRSKSREG